MHLPLRPALNSLNSFNSLQERVARATGSGVIPQTSLPLFRARARTLWFAARFLPPYTRTAVNGLYAFARAVDDLVDEPTSFDAEQIRSILSDWHAWLEEPLSSESAPDPRIASAVLPVLVDHGVPARHLQLLVDGVASDLDRREVASWPELREYCVQVASSVGLAMCHLLGAGEDRWPARQRLSWASPCS